MRRFLMPLAASFVATVAAPSLAAAQDAVVTADLNMRAGPSTSFPVVDVIPESAPVDVHGCLGGYSWCDVSSQGNRGWVSASYLSYAANGSYTPLIEYTSDVEIPIITYSVGSYWDSYYRDRPWYGRRAIWRDRWRDNWRDIRRHERADRRRDRREDRADRRQDRREDRVDRRRDRRGDRADRRENRRDAVRDRRRDARTERRGDRAERRTERRVNRVERRARPEGRQQRGQNFRSQRNAAPRAAPRSRPQRSGGGGRRGRDG
jgi:uncharacterized protein YraI